MIANRVAFAAAGLLSVAVPAFGQSAWADTAEAFIQKWDRSGKGVLGLKEVDNAAIVKFEMLDKSHQGRLTESDLSALLSPEEFKQANPDNDTTIGADEWFDLVKRRFNAANPDHDGSIDVNELRTPAGQALLKLVD
jgi:hypothetical protein